MPLLGLFTAILKLFGLADDASHGAAVKWVRRVVIAASAAGAFALAWFSRQPWWAEILIGLCGFTALTWGLRGVLAVIAWRLTATPSAASETLRSSRLTQLEQWRRIVTEARIQARESGWLIEALEQRPEFLSLRPHLTETSINALYHGGPVDDIPRPGFADVLLSISRDIERVEHDWGFTKHPPQAVSRRATIKRQLEGDGQVTLKWSDESDVRALVLQTHTVEPVKGASILLTRLRRHVDRQYSDVREFHEMRELCVAENLTLFAGEPEKLELFEVTGERLTLKSSGAVVRPGTWQARLVIRTDPVDRIVELCFQWRPGNKPVSCQCHVERQHWPHPDWE